MPDTVPAPFVRSLDRTIVLVGLMGVGKTTVGRRLAKRLGLDFKDADREIELSAGRSVSDIFADFGETAFREGERKVIARLLDEGRPMVLALGGGAFIDPQTRALIKQKAISVWLQADLETLMGRVTRRNTRPLLKTGDPRAVMARLLAERAPVYGEADITVDTATGTHQASVGLIVDALERHLAGAGS
ncbi:shikimate kinase [Marinicauda algicola]|uniref:Shikimate kinase n=1 Tax=Marinicauda algicola TaxID=2029849 RepID=A0A4S2H3M0_9PROT|nr:shikimate kinase [Marinicauda algicola]TGY90240.1 shikimate kinase [Marinicauda algicola]